jgi:hypothetical protein
VCLYTDQLDLPLLFRFTDEMAMAGRRGEEEMLSIGSFRVSSLFIITGLFIYLLWQGCTSLN